MPIHDRIEINSKIMLGKPVIRGTRIPVEFVVRKLSEGADEKALLKSYLKLAVADVHAALRYAADSLAHEEVVLSAAGIELGASGRRLLLTEDKDFGQLVFAGSLPENIPRTPLSRITSHMVGIHARGNHFERTSVEIMHAHHDLGSADGVRDSDQGVWP